MTESIRPAVPADLPAVLDIARTWPAHFVDEGLREIERDFQHGDTRLAIFDNTTVGFVIWMTDGVAMELRWLAVARSYVRRNIGSELVAAALAEIRTEKKVFLLTATLDSLIPGTAFEASGYQATNSFFGRLGFQPTGIIRQHWGPANHAQIMAKEI